MLQKLPNSSFEADYLSYIQSEFARTGGSGKEIVGFFSGGGGLDLGFAAAGFDLALSSDIVPEYCETLALNIPKHKSALVDVSKFDLSDLYNAAGTKEISGIVGGPPCQSFSILGKRGSVADPRGALIYDYISIIRQVRPEFFVFENVPGLTTINSGKDWHDLLFAFSEGTRYDIRTSKLNSVNFGIPQKRERVFIVGFRDFNSRFSWPVSTHGQADLGGDLLPVVTVADAFQSLAGTTNNTKRVHGTRVAERYSGISPGDRDRIDHTDRLEWTKPSGVVLVGSGGGGGRPFIHPEEHRHITVREAARLQSFPDWWEFAGGVTKQYRQVGNAVPPLMAKRLATSILAALG